MTTSERRGYYNRRFGSAPPPRAEDPIYERLHEYAGELLTIETIDIKVLVTTATVRHDSGVSFGINIRKREKDLLLQAGYILPTERGEYPFTATVTCHMVSEYGQVELRIKTVLPKDGGEPVTTEPIAEPIIVSIAPKNDNTVDKTLYKYHGETVTLISAVEKGYGNRKIWRLEARADDDSLLRVEAWSEVNKMLQDAGYPTLPERGAGKVTLNADAVIEYSESYKAYRVKHVFPQETAQPVTVAPVKVIIPVVIEMSWEDELRQLQAMINSMLSKAA